MKLVFAHDHIIYNYKDLYYSSGGLSGEALKKYVTKFGEVVILTRQRKIEHMLEGLSLSSIPGTMFIEVPNFKSIKSYYKIIEARKIIENEIGKADCVIARISSIGLMAIESAIKKNKPYMAEVVACSWDSLWYYGGLKAKIYAIYSYFKTKRLVLNASYVLYVTNKFLQGRYPTLGLSIGCSDAVIEDFGESVIDKRLQRIACSGNKLVIGTIGALSSKYKGFDTVIRALSILKKKLGPNIEYRLLGGGDGRHLEKMAVKFGLQDLVKFDGTLPSGKAVLNWLDNIDIYIQPSRAEGLPRAVVEAMSRGCPVIGSDAGGIPELLEENCIFHKSDYKRLAEIISENGCNQDWLRTEAIRNFRESKKYCKDKIDTKRDEFFNKFIYDINSSAQECCSYKLPS